MLQHMNTICDIVPNRLQKRDRKSEQITPPQRVMQVYQRILIGTDFSPASTPAFEQALKLAKQNGAELLIAHSCEIPNVWFATGDSYDEWKKHCQKEAGKSIGALVQQAHQDGVKAHALTLTGLADTSIVEAAKRLDVDLIVIGTHGRRGISKILLGSVAVSLVSLAPCAVLTVRSSSSQPKAAACLLHSVRGTGS
jgi:nucleotide-binding universal stress UspA family protein